MIDARSRSQLPTSATVSVALCTYNSARYIESQLRSILDQDLPAYEVVICDDGSSDETLSIIRRIVKAYSGSTRIRIKETSRVGGVVQNFERALNHCRGRFIALSDHDDIWTPRRLSTALAIAASARTPTLVFSDAVLIDGDGSPLRRRLFQAYGVETDELQAIREGRAFETLIRRNIVTGATVLFDRALLQSALPFGRKWIHDEWLAIIAAGVGSVICVEEPLIYYRIHGSNQIGVPPRFFFKRLWLALWPGNSRFLDLQVRAEDLTARLERVGAKPSYVEAARRRLVFENARRDYAWLPLVRGPAILRQWRLGSYREFERLSAAEAWRDLFQRF